MSSKGHLIVLSAPSGGGKSLIIAEILKQRPSYVYSVSSTTRPMREYEVDGRDYHFLSEEEFLRKIDRGEFVEWAEVHGYYYGTDHKMIEQLLAQDADVLLDLDVYGGAAILQHYRANAITIFIDPPSLEILRQRLKLRGSESDAEIDHRLSRYPMEKKMSICYQHHVVNDELNQTVDKILSIIDSYK